MALVPGTRIGPYEIVSALGAGGMGEVFRARDTRLKREVALKVLPPTVATDHDRIARFEREAEMLAALNHPNIAQIHGVVDADPSTGSGQATLVLVMELVEGEDLAARIARGPVAVDEALPIARQIADALEAAHERGIIHRDLKPANIKVRPDGTVKVLDFGLARADATRPDSAMSAVTSPAMTMQGVVIGTAAYMSPEQARGKPVDRRADVWAYGAVLFEMLTGKRPFDGSDATDTIAAVLRSEPDWQLLPGDLPEPVRMLIRRCLDKDPQRRPAHLSVATFVLSGGAETGTSEPRSSTTAPRSPERRRLVALGVSTFLAGIAVAGGVAWFVAGEGEPAVAPPVAFTIGFETGGDAWRDLTDRPFVISPDGRAVVYRATTRGLPRLYIRTLDQLEPRPLVAGALVRTPFFSPDSQWVAFFEGAALKKVPVSGGPPVEIARITGGGAFGASWGDDGSIVFGGRLPGRETGVPLMLVPASGGEPIALTTVDPGSENADTFPVWLPQSRGVLFRMYTAIRPASSETRLMLLDRATGERREIAAAVSGADFVAGRIVYADPQGQLYGLPFDPSTLTALGPATALAERVHVPPVGQAMFSAALSGALAFLPALEGPGSERGRSLVWVDRQGREEPLAAPPRAYAVPRLSPDGTRVALDIRDEDSDIWIRSLDRGVMTRLTSGLTLDMAPVWTPDGRRIIWTSTRDAATPTLYWQAADGTGAAERLNGPGIAFPGSVTPDGQAVLSWGAAAVNSLGAAAGIFRTALFGERSLDRVLGPMQGVLTPEVSPDGRWLAYESNESGQPEIYVRPYPNVDDGRWQISTEGGSRPAWTRNGRELFFLDGTDRLSVASIAVSGNTLAPGAPRRLLESAYYPGFSSRGVNLRGYDVSLDGQRFLMIKGPTDAAATQTVLTVVANWPQR